MIILHLAPINMTKANGFRFSVPGLVSAQSKLNGIYSGLLNIKGLSVLKKRKLKNLNLIFFLNS